MAVLSVRKVCVCVCECLCVCERERERVGEQIISNNLPIDIKQNKHQKSMTFHFKELLLSHVN